MLRLDDLAVARGSRVLYEHANAFAGEGEHVGLVGENGCGKSSLFAVILGELLPESGGVDPPPHDRIAWVAQSVNEVEEKALSYVIAGHARLAAAKAEHEAAFAGSDAMRQAAAAAELAEVDEGAVKATAESILSGLGFTPEDGEKTVGSFSGGWRNRLALARALVSPCDLLLLDEPTNHLDIDSLIWLESWLKKVRATVVIISHDREFLDRTTSATWAIENGTLSRYSGSYSSYEEQRIERLRAQDAASRAYARQSSHLAAYVERFRYKATKARQAQSRLKMLARLQAVEPVRSRREWRFEFPVPERTPDHLVDLEEVRLGYGERTVLSGIDLSIRSGERIGVLGVNGAGKSTLIKSIAGTLVQQSGTIRPGQGLVIGYFSQHQLDQLDMDSTPLESLRRIAPPNEREQVLRDFLGRYRFSGQFADTVTGSLSGGEKARLALALIAWRKPNLLILDEPTNHLDMATREALTIAVSTYEGTLVLVSHDRRLLRACCDRLLLVHGGRVENFDGDLDDYAALVLDHYKKEAEERRAGKKNAGESGSPALNRREERRQEAQERARIAALRKPLQKRLSQVEAEMASLAGEIASIDARIGNSDWYASAGQEELSETLRRRGEAASSLEELELEWLELGEKIESAC